MKLQIKNLGPIYEADLELGDITVIFGPPNTGKTYTLKALYTSTLMLDDVAREFELRRIVDEAVKDYPSVVDAIQVFSIIAIIYKSHLKLDDGKVKLLREWLREFIGVDTLDWYIDDDVISVTLKSCKSVNLSEILKTRMNVFWDILPLRRGTKVLLENFPSISEVVSLVTKSIEPHTFRESFGDKKQGIYLTLDISVESKTDGIVDIISGITLSCDISSPILKDMEKTLKNVEKAKVKRLIEKMQTVKDFHDLIDVIRYYYYSKEFHFYLRSYMRRQLKVMEPAREIIKKIFKEFIGDLLRTTYSELLDLQAVRFVPFGRSPIIHQLEYVSKGPIPRVEDLMTTFYGSDVLLYSYISWLSEGRAKIAEGKFDEKLINIFVPVLQGRLTYDKTQGLVYNRFGHSSVPIKWASALAGEVTGILLPILATPPKSMIIIEEPESQLHLSAQVLMALALAGLSSEYNHKLVFSTHSDIFALVLAYIKEYKPSEEEIKKLIKKMLKVQKIRATKTLLEPLVKPALKAKDLEINFYYYEPNKEGVKVLKRGAGEIIRNVPSLTDVIDEFTSWAFSLGGEKVG